MSYIGAQPTTGSFPFDQFSGNGSTTAFTLTYAPASTTSIIVAISGVVQNPNLYSVIGTTITFSPAPPTGTNNISVLYLGLPVIGVSSPGNTAYFSSTSFTATASQTTFTPSGSYQVGFINVIRNGSQLAPADYTATNGTTVVLNNACTAGDIVVIEVYTLTSISNALPLTGGTVTGATTFNAGVNLAANSGNVGIGTSSPLARFQSSPAQSINTVAALLTTGPSDPDFRAGFANGSGNTISSEQAKIGLFYSSTVTPLCHIGLLRGSTANSDGMTFNVNNIERARFDSSGNLLVGRTSALNIASSSETGFTVESNGTTLIARDGNIALSVGRQNSDGTIVSIRQAGAEEGSISVSGATVSYNAFAGSHWSQLQDGSNPEILRGTVMESIDELCEWDGEDNERLCRSKISDTANSKRVYGVFMCWDEEWTATNDMLVTSLGAFVCRVNAGVTVQMGDLLESNGDGTARVQADDIIRSSTIGKVTSTTKTHEYDDGSYCVPTVLYCG